MCLSTVYLVKEDETKEVLCKNVAEIISEGESHRLIDVCGIGKTVTGKIVNINLVDNYIELKA